MSKKHECPPPENTERWAVSYLDMITVMMCLFLVLYAISQVDQGKLAKLRQSLAAGFNNEQVAVQPVITNGGMGVLTGSTSAADLGSQMGSPGNAPKGGAERAAAAKEAKRLQDVKNKIQAKLETAGQGKALDYQITSRGLVMGMVASDSYFPPGEATLTPAAAEVLAVVAEAIKSLPDQISVDGYADTNPQNSAMYPTNTELAAGRSAKVQLFLISKGVAGNRTYSSSFGEFYPIPAAPGQDPLAINRRVDIVVLSNAPESVRQLLPRAGQQLVGASPNK